MSKAPYLPPTSFLYYICITGHCNMELEETIKTYLTNIPMLSRRQPVILHLHEPLQGSLVIFTPRSASCISRRFVGLLESPLKSLQTINHCKNYSIFCTFLIKIWSIFHAVLSFRKLQWIASTVENGRAVTNMALYLSFASRILLLSDLSLPGFLWSLFILNNMYVC